MFGNNEVTVGLCGNTNPPIESVIKAARRCEEQGYDSLWWYDHLMGWWPQSIWTPDIAPPARFLRSPHAHLDTTTLISSVGISTQRITLGPAVTEAIRRPPPVIAQDFLSLDHITRGRVILGMGAGEAANIIPYGLDYSKPISRMEEAITIIRLLWETDDPVDYDGQFWKLRGAINGLTPYVPGHYPPIWIGGFAPRTLRIVGRLADGWLPINLPLVDYKEKMQTIRNAAVDAGRDPDAITYALWISFLIDEDHEECHRMLNTPLIRHLCLALPSETFSAHGYAHPLGSQIFGANYIPSQATRERMLDAIAAVPFDIVHEHIPHGTPEDIAAYCQHYVSIGTSHLAFLNMTFAADFGKVKSSFGLAAELCKYLKGLSVGK